MVAHRLVAGNASVDTAPVQSFCTRPETNWDTALLVDCSIHLCSNVPDAPQASGCDRVRHFGLFKCSRSLDSHEAGHESALQMTYLDLGKLPHRCAFVPVLVFFEE